jgi:hypothetical protein
MQSGCSWREPHGAYPWRRAVVGLIGLWFLVSTLLIASAHHAQVAHLDGVHSSAETEDVEGCRSKSHLHAATHPQGGDVCELERALQAFSLLLIDHVVIEFDSESQTAINCVDILHRDTDLEVLTFAPKTSPPSRHRS